jgi:hypothetical protein
VPQAAQRARLGRPCGQHRLGVGRDGLAPAAAATIWRILIWRGFVVPQPHKRPRSSWHRFVAELPDRSISHPPANARSVSPGQGGGKAVSARA